MTKQTTIVVTGSLRVNPMNITCTNSSFEEYSDTTTFFLSDTRVNDIKSLPVASSWAFSGNTSRRASRKIFEILKLGCKGPREKLLAFVARRRQKVVQSPEKKKGLFNPYAE